MTLEEAISIINNNAIDITSKTIWADLGCGSGLFTSALASLLKKESIIYAVDNTHQQLPNNINGVNILFQKNDFVKDEMNLPLLDGIIMANALHYVADKTKLLEKLIMQLNEKCCFVIVEYNTMNPNRWVPYPINEKHLKELFHKVGFKKFTKTGERQSVYGPQKMYACVIQR